MKGIPRWLALAFTMTIALAAVPDLAELNRMIARFAPAPVTADTSQLAPGDKLALAKLLDAANVIDGIFREQLWAGNPALKDRLAKDTTPLGKSRYHYYLINNGPWSDLDDHAAFLPEVPPKKPVGAGFYPEDMSKGEFESWVAKLPKEQQEQATGFFTLIRRGANRALTIVPYNQAYASELDRAA